MSKEFYEIIETEIKRREEARIRQEKRKEKLEIERIKRIISNDFETYLRKHVMENSHMIYKIQNML